MTKRLMGCLIFTYAFIISCCGMTLAPFCAAEDAPLLTDAREYAVFAAVLFPKEPEFISPAEKNDSERMAYLATYRVQLDGISGNNYNLSRFTIRGAKTVKGSADQVMITDYNRRNEQSYRLDEERLLPLVPKGGRITLVNPGKTRIKEEGIMFSDGTTYISRPGFNKDLTKAILQINHVAGPEMGVGYQVYLEKSSSSGPWLITGLDLNRMY